MALTPAVFLDKDGTLLEDVPYNVEPRLMKLAPHTGPGLRLLGRLDVPLVVVSNQPGVALGRFESARLDDVAAHLCMMFDAHRARLAACYWCPHHPEGTIAGYRGPCDCRKPSPGLLRRAASDLRLDLARSWFVGDILDDVEAGRRAGCHTILVDNGGETEWRQDTAERRPEVVVANFHEAARRIAADWPAEFAP